MYAIDFGLFPFAGLLAGGSLYAVYYWGMRLKCSARAGQAYIVLAMLAATLFSVLSVARTTERDLPAVTTRVPNPVGMEDTGSLGSTYHGHTPTLTGEEAHRSVRPAVLQASASRQPVAETPPTLLEQGRATAEVLFSNAFALLGVLWLLGVVVVIGYFFVQLGYLYWFRHRQKRTGRDGHAIIYETQSGSLPFSFGRNVFLPSSLSDEVRHYVLMHELSHVRHRHFLKLCLLELVLAVNWFNPFVWLMFGEMRMQQEMEVDTDVLRQGVDRRQYQLSLVSVCTQQGRWILMQSAFLGGPLKKRLLFMNTPINPRRAQVLIAATLATACMVLVLLTTVSCRARQREKSHPLEGCWEMEWLRDSKERYGQRYQNRNIKFFGDYGELVLTYNRNDGVNIPVLWIAGMDQRVHNDTLLDVHGRPIDYQLKDNDRLIWRWHIQPGEENDHVSGVDQTEQWRRIKPDPELINMFRALSQADKLQAESHLMNGVWKLDSVVALTSQGELVARMVTSDQPSYLLMGEPYYMRIDFQPSVNKEVWNFGGNGDCGVFSLTANGYIQLQQAAYEVNGLDSDHFTLSINESRNPESNKFGIWHYFYHRVPMPGYVRRIFRPALAVAEAEQEQQE